MAGEESMWFREEIKILLLDVCMEGFDAVSGMS